MGWNEIAVSFLLLSGVGFILVGSIGILVMPDVLCRAHALSKALTLGLSLMLIGLWFYLGTEKAGLKALLAIFFQFITIPLSGHLFAYFTAHAKRNH